MQRLFRDVLPSILVILSCALFFFILFQVVDSVNQLGQSVSRMSKGETYTWSNCVTVSTPGETCTGEPLAAKIVEIINTLSKEDSTTGIIVANSWNGVLILSGGELPKRTATGEVLKGKKLLAVNEPIAYVGDAYKSEMLREKNGSYISLYGDKVKVQGFISKKQLEEDSSLFLCYNTFSETARKQIISFLYVLLLDKQPVTIFSGSNESSEIVSSERLMDIVEGQGLVGRVVDVSKENIHKDDMQTTWSVVKTALLVAVASFGVVSIIYSAKLWVSRQEKNIAILYSCGASKKMIIKHLMGVFLPILYSSSLVCLIITVVFYLSSRTSSVLYIISVSILALLLTAICSLCVAVVTLQKVTRNEFIKRIANER